MNKHAYLIIAHRDMDQLQRLINALDAQYNDIFVHIDKKYNDQKKINLLKTKHSQLYVVNSIDVRWGDYSIVECELLLLNMAIKNNYSYYHLLSGDDFPLKSSYEIYNFFEKTGKEFVSISQNQISSSDMERIIYRHICLGKFKTSKYRLINKFYFLVDNLGVFFQKKLCMRKKIYYQNYQKGSQWFSITRDFAIYVIAEQSKIKRAFQKTLIPDELFIQTVLVNSKWKDSLYAPLKYNSFEQNMRYIDWNRGKPYIFRSTDYDELISSGCMFARKFSLNVDENIIMKLENKNRIEDKLI